MATSSIGKTTVVNGNVTSLNHIAEGWAVGMRK